MRRIGAAGGGGRIDAIFKVHRQLIDDYKSFTTSSVTPLDPRIAQYVHDELAEGKAVARALAIPEPDLRFRRLDRRPCG